MGLRALVPQKTFGYGDLIRLIHGALETGNAVVADVDGEVMFSHLSYDGFGDFCSIRVVAGGKQIRISTADVEDENAE